ncbi:adenylate/guanylate cyclase domain-containing protein [Streptomyces sp. SID3343]|uniref:adenylate/guanylate cyclase domain-containing protein n=1 Tax=Streptomyces sp. SID3343 TaxID=2690260 RepID=UPI00136F1900|nr:adenylate/guanylate cyclase domain-containing protein [Streptomyces sp. SID3343]MYW01019.1 adenylate/guanylate cyclase domain-containing protein [Streptomyces sp. SID3343]
MTGEDPAADELETLVLRHKRRYTSKEVAALAGVPVYRARRFWRALGFANVEDDAPEFTDADVDALVSLLRLVSEDIFDERQAVSLARSLGRATASLAESQIELGVELLDRKGVLGPDRTRILRDRAHEILPELERLMLYCWRRQLAVSVGRVAQSPEAQSAPIAVGFADLVGFTRLSRRLGEQELAQLVERFEGRSADVVTAEGGRVIKTLGDSVLFVADSARDAAEIALRLVATHAGERTIPALRVGMAMGPVLARMGDVFGDTVNLASRITSLAAHDQILVDTRLATELQPSARFALLAVGPVAVSGFDNLDLFVLGRSPSAPPVGEIPRR